MSFLSRLFRKDEFELRDITENDQEHKNKSRILNDFTEDQEKKECQQSKSPFLCDEDISDVK